MVCTGSVWLKPSLCRKWTSKKYKRGIWLVQLIWYYAIWYYAIWYYMLYGTTPCKKRMLLATSQKQLRPLNLYMKADHIEQVYEHRQFVVIIDNEFNWQSHVSYVCKTVSNNPVLFLWSQFKHFVNTSKSKLFYHAHISSHRTYASAVCNGCSDVILKTT